MDKLELDARVDHLERRVSLLSALILGLLLAGGGLALTLMVGRTETRPAITIATPTVEATRAVFSPAPLPDQGEGSVGRLVIRLSELETMRKKSLLTPLEFQGQKEGLLKKPIKGHDLRVELEQLDALRQQGTLSGLEYQDLKAKLLEASR